MKKDKIILRGIISEIEQELQHLEESKISFQKK